MVNGVICTISVPPLNYLLSNYK